MSLLLPLLSFFFLPDASSPVQHDKHGQIQMNFHFSITKFTHTSLGLLGRGWLCGLDLLDLAILAGLLVLAAAHRHVRARVVRLPVNPHRPMLSIDNRKPEEQKKNTSN